MSFEILLAIRYLRSKRGSFFISLITFISVIGVGVGVMALIVVLSVMNGFRKDLISKILGVNSHIMILNVEGCFKDYEKIEEKLRRIDEIVAFTPFLYSQVMIKGYGGSSGAVLTGIDVRSVRDVLDIDRMIKKGSLDLVKEKGIIIGIELAKRLSISVGDIVTLISPEGKLTPFGRIPNSESFKVVGFFESGMYEYDSSFVYLSLKEAQKFLDIGDRITGIEVRIKDPEDSEEVAKKIEAILGYPFIVKDWKEMNKSLFSALKIEKITMFVILTMIVLVGALNIISSLVLMVMDKSKDIAILRAIGASSKSIMRIFVIQGIIIGTVGTALGIFSGLGICYLLEKYKFITLPADVYYISRLPVEVEMSDVLIISISAIIISFLATVYPARYAGKVNPVDVLRYE